MRQVVTIDGPSGSGKSTVARMLSEKLGYVHLDTGAMYRAVALAAWRKGIPYSDAPALDRMCRQIRIELLQGEEGPRVLLDGEDVTDEIRLPEMSLGSSSVSAIPAVRAHMVRLQREIGKNGGVVAEGRDMGTVVFRDAGAKFYLDASLDVRARRRWRQILENGGFESYEKVLDEMKCRDHNDSSRKHSPLKMADDAFVIDSTEMTAQEVTGILARRVRELEKPGA
jgi:cytidylate kinase